MAKEPTDKEAEETAKALAEVETPTPKEEEPTQEATEPSEKSVETPEKPIEEAPEEPRDAKAFQAMRQRIKELEAQVSVEKSAEVGPLVPQLETPQQTTINQNQFFNQETGEFDAVGYQSAVRQEAITAANTITNQRLEEEHQTQEAIKVYPALDPSDKTFDQDLYDATSALLLQSMVKGQKITVKQAAEKALGLSKKALKEAAETGAKQAEEELAAKEAASLEATASSGRATQDMSDLELLQEKTRQGGPEGAAALSERIKRSGF